MLSCISWSHFHWKFLNVKFSSLVHKCSENYCHTLGVVVVVRRQKLQPYKNFNLYFSHTLIDSCYLSIESDFVGFCLCGAFNLLFFPMQFIWPVNTDEMWFNLYLHLFTTKFVTILFTLTQKCHISKISNVQKVRHLEQPAADGWRTEQSCRVIQCK